jgi:hypothetical protein
MRRHGSRCRTTNCRGSPRAAMLQRPVRSDDRSWRSSSKRRLTPRRRRDRPRTRRRLVRYVELREPQRQVRRSRP